MTDQDPDSVINVTYNGSNVIHYVCKLGNAPILEVMYSNKQEMICNSIACSLCDFRYKVVISYILTRVHIEKRVFNFHMLYQK